MYCIFIWLYVYADKQLSLSFGRGVMSSCVWFIAKYVSESDRPINQKAI